jgi:hypothetical protein
MGAVARLQIRRFCSAGEVGLGIIKDELTKTYFKIGVLGVPFAKGQVRFMKHNIHVPV